MYIRKGRYELRLGSPQGGSKIRIVSARPAEAHERKQYEERR
jgi:uncharacterized DUF497 family protein